MFLSKILVLCTVAGTVFGYGYGYRSYGSSEEKTECKKLMHYDVTPPTNAQLNRKAKFIHLTKNGKDYVMISCPNDSFKYALISENCGSVFDISGSEYPNTVVLAAGFKVGFITKCHGNKILAETTDGKKVRLDKIACIQYSGGSAPPVTVAPVTPNPCTLCDIESIKPDMDEGTSFSSTDVGLSDSCTVTRVICQRDDDLICSTISITGSTPDGTTTFETASDTNTATVTLTCNSNSKYSDVTKLNCNFVDCQPPPSCKTCDITKLLPTSFDTGTILEHTEQAAEDSCKSTKVTCKRTDDQVCTKISIIGTIPTGSYLMFSSPGSVTESSVALTCMEDGTYTFSSFSQIKELGCVFEGCATPPSLCDTCDTTASIFLNFPGTTITQGVPSRSPAGCIQIGVTCANNGACSSPQSMGIQALGTSGNVVFTYEGTSNAVSRGFECRADGLYGLDDNSGIAKFKCTCVS